MPFERKQEAGSREQEAGSREQKAGSRQQGAGRMRRRALCTRHALRAPSGGGWERRGLRGGRRSYVPSSASEHSTLCASAERLGTRSGSGGHAFWPRRVHGTTRLSARGESGPTLALEPWLSTFPPLSTAVHLLSTTCRVDSSTAADFLGPRALKRVVPWTRRGQNPA